MTNRGEDITGTLYIVGTPIGNLGDITLRGLETLKTVDFIAAEDTRVTLRLLNHFDIKKPLISCHEHSGEDKIQALARRIVNGENCALVSDAGMPCISDPGTALVNACYEAEITVTVVPGATAFTAALCLSGTDAARFSFEGFLSMNKTARKEHLTDLKNSEYTLIFYEAPHKLIRTLADMLKYWGDREISVVKELTKIHEKVRRTTLIEALEYYTANTPKGEYVLLIKAKKTQPREEFTVEQAAIIAQEHIKSGFSASESAKKAAKETGISKSEIYKRIHT